MHIVDVELATAAAIAPFGTLVGAVTGANRMMQFEGVQVYGSIPFRLSGTPELIVCDLPRRPLRIGLMECHFHHTQCYLPLNGKPFVMALAPPGEADVPRLDALRAFLFAEGQGISLGEGVWHEFPLALEDATHIAVVLTAEAHIAVGTKPEVADDADGPDLKRRSFVHRPGMEVELRMPDGM